MINSQDNPVSRIGKHVSVRPGSPLLLHFVQQEEEMVVSSSSILLPGFALIQVQEHVIIHRSLKLLLLGCDGRLFSLPGGQASESSELTSTRIHQTISVRMNYRMMMTSLNFLSPKLFFFRVNGRFFGKWFLGNGNFLIVTQASVFF